MSVALLLLCSLLTCGCCHDVMSIEQLTYAVGKLDRKVEALEEDKVKLTLKLETLEADKTKLTLRMQLLEQKMEDPNRKCGCPKPDFKPHSCADERLLDKTSGVRALNVNGRDITVYCDQRTSGGGWAMFQRRFDGSVVFDRNWADYEDGFGHVSGEYWLGLRNIYQMTSSGNYILRVDLEDFSGKTAYAEYSHFSISGPEDNYRLHVSGYSGTAGDNSDGLLYNNNMQFSTRDRDHDLSQHFNCVAYYFHGGFWYNNCSNINPNGVYKNTAVTGQHDSMSWYPWRTNSQALRRVEMKIRPA